MDANRLAEIDAVVVDEAFALGLAVGPGGDRLAHTVLGVGGEQLGGFENDILAVAFHQFANAPLAQPRRAHLAAQVAEHQRRGAAVGRDHGVDLFDRLEARHEFDRRQMQAFLIDFPGGAAAAAGDGAADVALVRHVGGEADPVAAKKNRREHAHVGRVGAAAEVGMVGDESVAVVDFVKRKSFQDRRGAGGKGAHVERQDDMLGDHFAAGVEHRAAGVLGFSDDRRVAGAEERILHLLDDAGQARLDDLQGDGIDRSHRREA